MLDIPVERVYFLNRLAKKVFAFTTQNTRGVPSPRGLNFAPGAIGTALLSLLSVCMPAQATLVDNGNGTVTDTASGLMWLKDANAMGLVNWQTASSGAANLTVAGVGGWRLPAIDELKALYATLNASGTFNPAPFSNLQIDGVSDWFWSNTKSTPVCWYSYCFDTAYYMGFDTGTSATATVDYQLSALPVRSAFEYSVRVIDDSVYSTYSDPRPAGINNQGQTVGYSFRPYVWDAVNGLRKLSYSTTDGGGAYAINNAGVAVGSINTSTGARPIMWTVAATEANTTFTLLPTLGGSDAIPNNINGSGSIVGWAKNTAGVTRAVSWQSGNIAELPSLSTGTSQAYDISDNGFIAGYSVNSNNVYRALVWDANGYKELGALGGTAGLALGINNAGTHVVGTAETKPIVCYYGCWSVFHAFVWTAANGMQDLGDLTGGKSYSWANDVNDKGTVVGSSFTPGNNYPGYNHAFIWKNGVMRDLNTLVPQDTTWELSDAVGINGEGQIVALQAIKPNGSIMNYARRLVVLTPNK